MLPLELKSLTKFSSFLVSIQSRIGKENSSGLLQGDYDFVAVLSVS
jgi:hypothetical protein